MIQRHVRDVVVNVPPAGPVPLKTRSGSRSWQQRVSLKAGRLCGGYKQSVRWLLAIETAVKQDSLL